MASAMDKILDSDSLIGRNTMTIYQGKEKMFTLYHKIYDKKMQTSTIQTKIYVIFKNTIILNVSNFNTFLYNTMV